ncbi:MAG: hypothetical protein ACRDNY_10225 [Gaiellaceae bacterium]
MVEPDPHPAVGGSSLPSPPSFLEWPHGIARLGVVLCVALALGYGVVYFVKAVDWLGDEAGSNSAQNLDDREFAGGNALVVANAPLYEARGLIPENETYRVVTGPNVAGASDLTEDYVDQFARYFLMPRRPSPDARWIICYGCDPEDDLGNDFEVLWQGETPGILLGRLPS